MADSGHEAGATPRRSMLHRVARGLAWLFVSIGAVLLALIVFLHTPPGRQFIVDQIAKVAPASGLSVEVGSIDGSVLWSASFNDVKLRDAEGRLFLEVPRVDLNWRPWKWFVSGLDMRHLVLSGGTLYAVPELLPGDPDAPLLPDFDIQVGRLVIEDLTVAEGMLGEERLIQFRSKADIRQGRVFVDAEGEFGGEDVFTLLVDANPDGDVFDLDLDWRAPAGGFLASLAGAEEDLLVQVEGDGTWTSWQGALGAQQGGAPLLDFDIYNETGQYRLVGQAFPGAYVDGVMQAALGQSVAFTAIATLRDSVIQGSFALRGQGVDLDGSGGVDLAENAFRKMQLEGRLLDPALFGSDILLDDAELDILLDGGFADASFSHELRIGRIAAGKIVFDSIFQQGTALVEDGRLALPLDARVARVTSGVELFDPGLVNGKLRGTLTYTGRNLTSDNLAIDFPGFDARLGLRGNVQNGRFHLSGPVNAQGLVFDGMGVFDAATSIDFAIGGRAPWVLTADLRGRMQRIDDSTLETLTGGNVTFAGDLAIRQNAPLTFANMAIKGNILDAEVDGRLVGGETLLTFTGAHADYGPFEGEARLAADGPHADLVLADPLPAAGLKNVRVALSPTADGFAIETSGASMLGSFGGLLDLALPADGNPLIGVRRFDLVETRLTGDLRMVDGGVSGSLDLSRGGVDGRIGLAARPAGQAFDIDLTARNARFGGETPLMLARADVDMRGFIGGDATTVEGEMSAQGLSWGNFFLGRVAAGAQLRGGVGSFNAAMAGRRGSRFELLLNGEAQTDRIALAARGSYAGKVISMPRRAVLDRKDDGGWELQRSQLGYGGGFAVLRGHFGGEQGTEGRLSLSALPLSLVDVVVDGLGLGGTISGTVDFAQGDGVVPAGLARIQVNDLTRSGLILTSRPMDLSAVVDLSPSLLQARAVMDNGGSIDGQLNARIADLPQRGSFAERLYAGDLFAQLRYAGPAEALWRLAALDLIDISGRLELATNVRGSLGDPQVRGSLQGDDLQVQSALTGTDISGVSVNGRFDGSRLQLTSFAGTSPNGGRVSGSGFVDLSGISRDRGPQMDIRIAANNARILQLPGMGATVTGPLRIVSNGVGGTIAGRLEVRSAEWRLANADEVVDLPDIAIEEINLPVDIAPPRRGARPWRYLINANASRGIEVDGMGLDSEWSGELRLRGTTSDPRIGGEVRTIPRQSYYTFAGTRFELTRGRIDFDENEVPDPRLDLLAEADVNGLDIDVTVRGSASASEITFSSVPALPQEELLARMLFGGSVTDLSPTDAVQLGAALASLRGGGGLDPINQLRTAIGLDRLRIITADPALDRGTSVALGKNFTRQLYAELVTDGQGYNATDLEFRVTSWLSLLGSLNTLGRGFGAVEVSRDY